MKLKAILKTSFFYFVVLLISIVLYYIIYSIKNKIYSVQGINYIYIIIYSLLKYIALLLIALMTIFMISITKEIYLTFLNGEKIVYISSKNYINTNDLRFLIKFEYTSHYLKPNILINLLLSIIILIELVLVYFIIAFSTETFLSIRKMDNIIYIMILFLWTLIFTMYFYISYNKFFDTSSREIHIYLLLIALYIIALLIKHNLFFNILSLYKPTNDSWINTDIQIFFAEYLVKYSDYIIDWALIQGVLLAILIYCNFGKKRQNKYEKTKKENLVKYQSLMKIVNIIEEIYKDDDLKNYCLNIEKNINEENYLFVNKLVKYNEIIMSIYEKTDEKHLIWFLKLFSLYFLVDSKYIMDISEKSKKEKIRVCKSCKQIFFSSKEKNLCEQCHKNAIAITKNTFQ